MKKYNISKPKKYIDRNTGQEKTYWANIGTMTEFTKQDGTVSRILEIPAISLEANIFPIEPKEPYPPRDEVKPKVVSEPQIDSDINPEDIPW